MTDTDDALTLLELLRTGENAHDWEALMKGIRRAFEARRHRLLTQTSADLCDGSGSCTAGSSASCVAGYACMGDHEGRRRSRPQRLVGPGVLRRWAGSRRSSRAR